MQYCIQSRKILVRVFISPMHSPHFPLMEKAEHENTLQVDGKLCSWILMKVNICICIHRDTHLHGWTVNKDDSQTFYCNSRKALS